MGNREIPDLTALGATPADDDLIIVYDTSTGIVKSVTYANLRMVSDTAYDATSWNEVTKIAPSKNAVRDKIETLIPKSIFTQDGGIIVGTGAGAYQEETGATARLSLNVSCALDAISRSQFTYSDADQITCGAASYMCKDKYCSWVSTITTVATGAAAGADWWYLYLDYSAITSGTAITASELIWSITEPTWNTTYRQWMNGNDRCIFAVRTDSGDDILEFLHYGDLTLFADTISDFSADVDASWVDVVLTAPKFALKVQVTIKPQYENTASVTVFWRTNGQTGDAGHRVGFVTASQLNSYFSTPVITDSDGIIEVKWNDDSGNNTITVYNDGWYFPVGM